MNVKKVYKKVLLEESLREYLLPKTKKFVDDNRAFIMGEITKTQWNSLLSFCMRKENVDDMIAYIQEKKEKKESPWRKRVKEEGEGEESTIGEYIIKNLQVIKESRLVEPLNAECKIKDAFFTPEENLENILNDDDIEGIVLLQARLFIRTLVKNVLAKIEEDLDL